MVKYIPKLNSTERVYEFCYSQSIVTNRHQSTADIKRRIALTKQAFFQKYSVISKRHLELETRKKFIESFVRSVLCHEWETWTVMQKDKNKLQATEIWLWRKM